MRKYYGIVSNNTYTVGCTSRTVYIFDSKGNELGKLRNISCGYRPLLSQFHNILVIKSTSGWLAFYDLDRFVLVKKMHFSKQIPQDSGLCFSEDGKYLYNLEMLGATLGHQIVRYDMQSFECHTIVQAQAMRNYSEIRYSSQLQRYCILGHGPIEETDVYSRGSFIAYFNGDKITEILPVHETDDYLLFMRLTASRFDNI